MSGALYERYKEALRRGHVAALRGRLEEALGAYAEAASIATERPLPHSSLGTVNLRLGRVEEALASFDAALVRAPRDEAALLGRADALVRADRAAEAAAALDVLVEVQEAAGRPLEALESARRAAGLAGSRRRRREVARLATGSGPASGAKAGPRRAARRPPKPAPERRPAPESRPEREPLPPEPEPATPDLAAPAEPEAAPPEPPAPSGPESAADPAALASEADRALAAGDDRAARRALLAAAAAYSSRGLRDAALEACHRALEVAPDDPDVHLAFVELYVARGWWTLAVEKLTLLERLVILDGDDEALARVRSAASAVASSEGRRTAPAPG